MLQIREDVKHLKPSDWVLALSLGWVPGVALGLIVTFAGMLVVVLTKGQ